MNFSCPRCSQALEAEEEFVGHAIACPTCGQKFSIPNAVAPSVPVSVRTAAPVRNPGAVAPTYRPPNLSSYTPPAPSSGGGGFGKLLLLGVVLCAGAFGYACFEYDESPGQVWNRLMKLVAGDSTPQPAATPTPASTPEPTATPIPVPVATPAPTPVATPTPPPDPLAWLLDHNERWPKEVAISNPVEFPAVLDGKVVGAVKMPAGTVVKVTQIEPGIVVATYNGGSARLPFANTDLKQRATQAMAVADAEAAADIAKAQAAKAKTEADAAASAAAAAAATPASLPSSTSSDSTAENGSDDDMVADAQSAKNGAFVHPGLLHNEEDFKRMRAHRGNEPWKASYERLQANWHASLKYEPHALEEVVRGRDRLHTEPENYRALFNDIAAAYACALRWRVSGDHHYADKAVEILNAWSSTLKRLSGSTDVDLSAGIYGYEFANAAEIMRSYKKWSPEDLARFQKMMLDVFYPINSDFLKRHNGTPLNHYWANWDLCNMASLIAIGVLCDKRSIYMEGIRYFKHGKGNGSIRNCVNYLHPGDLGQWQESGRDQGHTVMGIGIMGAICEMAWKQGDDLYGYDDNRFLKGCEYVAKYNLGEDVPFHPYTNDKGTQDKLGEGSRGNLRPVWDLVYNHYVKRKGLPAPYTAKMAEKVRPEGGGGDYGPNSGGFDQLGYGTLTATLDAKSAKAASASSSSTPSTFFGDKQAKAPEQGAEPAGKDAEPGSEE